MAVVNPLDAEALMLKAGLQPLEPYTKAINKWKCQCLNCGEIVFPKYCMIKHGQGGCKKCGYKKLSEKNKKLHAEGKFRYSKRPRLNEKSAVALLKKIGRTPLGNFKGSKSKWKTRCNKCHTVGYTPLSTLKMRGNVCRICGDKRTADAKKLSQKQVKIVFEKAGVKLLVPYPYENDKPLKCRCLRCKRIVTPTYANAKKHKEGCKYCAGTYVDPIDAKKLMIKKGYKPLEKYKGTDIPWKVKHIKCGSIGYPTYGTIKRGGGGCKNCADWGYSYNKPSYLYLITHKELNAHKIGIANQAKLKKSDRLHKYKNHGWLVYKTWHFEEGFSAMQIEAKIFNILRDDLKIPIFLLKGQLKYQGETETVNADTITLLELEKIINKVIKGYRNNP